MNQTQTRSLRKKVLSLILAVVMVVSLLPISAFASGDSKASTTATTSDGYEYNIMFLDCGRKYYSVDSIKQIIDNASAAGFNYIQLAVGNDGLRFLLNDMSLTVNGTTYGSDAVKEAIQTGNTTYNASKSYKSDKNELSESEMDAIIAYAASKGMGVIPCVNTPGHMDAILSAASSLTGTNCSYSSSARTIDVTNTTAVAFTQALLQKYITYFAGKNCKLFNMGADEYANDKFTGGSMGFGNLQSTGKYRYYVQYVNQLAAKIKAAGMTPMAFNDGIYFNNNTSSGEFDTDIVICYWSSGWSGYTPMSASDLASKGFQLINTNGSYYWILGGNQCDAKTASNFDKTAFPGKDNTDTINNPAGSMFCIWADYPGAETEASVISKTAATIAAFGKALPQIGIKSTSGTALTLNGSTELTVPGNAEATWSVSPAGVIELQASGNADERSAITGKSVIAKAVGAGTAKVTATVDDKTTYTTTLTVTDPSTVDVKVAVNGTKTITVDGNYAGEHATDDPAIATVATEHKTSTAESIKYDASAYASIQAYWNPSSPVSNVIDGNSGTYYWSSKAQTKDAYVQIDLSAAIPFDTVRLTSPVDSGDICTNAHVLVSADGENWTKIGSYTGSTTPTTFTNTLDKVRYIKVQITEPKDNWWKLSEIEWGNTVDGKFTRMATSGTVNTGTKEQTTITFTGKSVGDTSVQIGDVTYKIHVVAEDLSKVTPLTIEYWITNRQVTANGGTNKEINADDSTINSETGAKFTDLVPASGVGSESNAEVVFWKGTQLDSDKKQTADKGNDKTRSGLDFTYIRYWGSQWSFSADGTDWRNFESGDQIVAYYLQKTDVTAEVTTEVADWGSKRTGYNDSKFVLLDYAVKYESGDRSPDTFPVDNKTLAFHCNYESTEDLGNTVIKDGSTYYRKIGAIRAEETAAGYEVYMITVTPTSDTKTKSVATTPVIATDYAYEGTEKVVWVDKETDLGDFADRSKQYEGFSVGGDAVVPGLNIYNQQGMLVTYYVRAKAMPGSLTVHYVDKATGDEFHSYSINVTNTVENQTLFKENIGLADSWKGRLVNGDVVNNVGVKQWVSADLSTMPSIPTKYRYAPNYTCVDVVRSADGKEVTLYYTFKMDKTFVVDFGLPLVIKPTDISANLGSAMLTGVTANSSTQQNYADITSDANCNITYKLTTMLNGADKLDVKYDGQIPVDDGTQIGSVSYEVGIIPASTVYYEDNFVEFSAEWTPAGTTETNAVQQLDELGKTGANNYGYDKQYKSSSQFSLDSAMKTTVSRATNSNPPTATFTFKGTGFDLVSMTSKDTGTILVNVVGKDGAGKDVKENWIVDTFYGYTRTLDGYIQYTWTKGEDGKWHNKAEKISALPADATTGGTPVKSGDVTYELNYIWTPVTDQSNALYQIPVIHYTDLPYGTYTVTITPKYSSARDPYYTADGDNSYDFYLDGVRIYNPAGDTLNDQYVKDHEGYAQFTEIRDMLLSASSLKDDIEPTTKGMVFVDGVGDKGTLTDYTNYGPNNEVYLSGGQAIAFKISDMSNVDTIQIGAKAPGGNTTMQIKVDGNDVQTQELTTASDMYYKLDSVTANETVVITNTSGNLLSLTTLKVTYKTAPTAMNSAEAIVDSDVLAQAPVMLTSMLYGEPQTFEPSRFEASWGRSVRAGQKATLTVKASDDVGAIEVNGVTIDTYRTRTERTGWGWWAKRVTYREFTYTMTAEATADYAVYALNSDGIKSEPTTATLTVKPAINWWHKWF